MSLDEDTIDFLNYSDDEDKSFIESESEYDYDYDLGSGRFQRQQLQEPFRREYRTDRDFVRCTDRNPRGLTVDSQSLPPEWVLSLFAKTFSELKKRIVHSVTDLDTTNFYPKGLHYFYYWPHAWEPLLKQLKLEATEYAFWNGRFLEDRFNCYRLFSPGFGLVPDFLAAFQLHPLALVCKGGIEVALSECGRLPMKPPLFGHILEFLTGFPQRRALAVLRAMLWSESGRSDDYCKGKLEAFLESGDDCDDNSESGAQTRTYQMSRFLQRLRATLFEVKCEQRHDTERSQMTRANEMTLERFREEVLLKRVATKKRALSAMHQTDSELRKPEL